MKKLNSCRMESCIGGVGGTPTNRDCMIGGALALGAALTGNYGPAFIISAGATWAGCFH